MLLYYSYSCVCNDTQSNDMHKTHILLRQRRMCRQAVERRQSMSWQLDPGHPYISFMSKCVIMQDAQHGQLVGDLTIRNITREVVLDGEYSGVSQTPWNTYSAGFSLRGKVNRKEWGLNWNMVLAGGGLVAGDDITLAIDLELTRPVEAVAIPQAG